MRFIIPCCYDSHVHWRSTGQFDTWINLSQLKSTQEILDLTIPSEKLMNEWVIGFGWDHNRWKNPEFPSRQILDQRFPNVPVCFSRVDGHARWLNTEALKRCGIFSSEIKCPQGGLILRDETGLPTGILIDQAISLIADYIPMPDARMTNAFLRQGMKLFNQSGFTHIRDVFCCAAQWNEEVKLAEQNELTMFVEQFFSVDEGCSFDTVLDLCLKAKRVKLDLIDVKGIKIYFDGALGSEGALLSHGYGGGKKENHGLALLTEAELREIMIRTWQAKLELAVHVIGDEAVHRVVSVAAKLIDENFSVGVLHLEHVEILRPETLNLMQKISVMCHLQPCHWLSDRHWLHEKIGNLYDYCFPWGRLQENAIPFDFGSDSPIEKADVWKNFVALQESAQNGIQSIKGGWQNYHSFCHSQVQQQTLSKKFREVCALTKYSELAGDLKSYSIFDDDKIIEVSFLGRQLL